MIECDQIWKRKWWNVLNPKLVRVVRRRRGQVDNQIVSAVVIDNDGNLLEVPVNKSGTLSGFTLDRA